MNDSFTLDIYVEKMHGCYDSMFDGMQIMFFVKIDLFYNFV